MRDVSTFQGLILALQDYWARQGCVLLQPYDMEVGAGTFHPATFLRAIGPEPWSAAYVQPSRRPTDSRQARIPTAFNTIQYQVVIKLDESSLDLGETLALVEPDLLEEQRIGALVQFSRKELSLDTTR